MKVKDLTTHNFGRLTALHRLHNTKGKTKWLCVCDCGNFTVVQSYDLTSGHTKSCGCLNRELVYKRSISHGNSNERLYNIYYNMRSRCYNNTDKNYKYYCGRGIEVCKEWLNDFQTFYDWAINNGYNDTLTIDRIDNNKGYSPSNCRWVTNKEQQRNKRNNRNITINGDTRCLKEWCEILNLNYKIVWQRLYKLGWTIEKALELEDK